MDPRALFAELRRRNVFRAAALYAAGAWVLVQVATQVFPFFGIPDWTVRWIVVAAVIGVPFWVAFAWFYEFTPQGLKRESEVVADESIARSTGRKLDFAIIAVLAIAVVLLLTDRFVVHRDAVVEKSIAVLPLSNESGDPDNDYFSDGLSEELIASLTQIGELKVIGRNSSFQFRRATADSQSIGRKLGVATLLEGTVRRQGDRVHIVIGLIRAADGQSLWSQVYDRELKDIFAVQGDIAKSVAAALQVTLLGKAAESTDKPPSGDIDAYNAYLQGRFHYAQRTTVDVRKAIDYYNQAIRIDPQYAMALAMLSDAWLHLGTQFLADAPQARQAYATARITLDKAFAIDPNLAEAHWTHSELLSLVDFDQAGAAAEMHRALELEPNNADFLRRMGELLANVARFDEAVVMLRRAQASDPLSAGGYAMLSHIFQGTDRLQEAEQAARKVIELRPEASNSYGNLALTEILRGDSAQALRDAALEQNPFWRERNVIMAHAIRGDPQTDALLQAFIGQYAQVGAFQIAEVYALRKQPDQAFEWLQRAWDERDPGLVAMRYSPFLKPYQHDPRFAAMCVNVGLPMPQSPPAVVAATH